MSERIAMFGIGDKVKIVNYGSLLWESKDVKPSFKVLSVDEDGTYWCDMNPELVGKEGLVCKVSMTQGFPSYALDGISKYAWYNEEQLELVKKNPNNLI